MSNKPLQKLDAIIRNEVGLLARMGESEQRCVEIIRSRHADLIAELAIEARQPRARQG